MFFEKAKDARIYASIQTTTTKRKHIVIPCVRYLCPPKTYFGKDNQPGFTIQLKVR